MKEVKLYVSDALSAVEFKLIRDRDDLIEYSQAFHPEMAHQIFGETEKIFGYTDLKVLLYYNAGSLTTYVDVQYSSKLTMEDDRMRPDDIAALITDKFTGGYITNRDEFISTIDNEDKFVPMGEKVGEYEFNTDQNEKRLFEFYVVERADQKFINYHQRFETFILWFVDAASYIDHTDRNWLFFLCYEKYKNKSGNWCYASVGYSTIYQYYAYPKNVRARLSQILVLPPFQKLGIGTKIIETIYNRFKGDVNVIEVTVEDPSDDFQSVRNYIDAGICRQLPAFSVQNLKTGFNKDMVEEARKHGKINAIQCRRVYEILRLLNTNRAVEDEYRAYRLDVKRRLNMVYYKQQRDLEKLEKRGMDTTALKLAMTPIQERIEQLREEYKVCEWEYDRVVRRLRKDSN